MSVDQVSVQGEVGCDLQFEVEVFHVVCFGFCRGGAAVGVLKDDGDSSSGSVLAFFPDGLVSSRDGCGDACC